MIRSYRSFSALVVVLSLSACGPLLPKGEAAPRLFSLNAEQRAMPVYKAAPYSLRIQEPQMAPGLNTERIALKKSAHEMDYYAGAKWNGSLAALIQTRMVDGFERSKTLRAVAADTVPFKADYILSTDVTDFQAEYGAGGTATESPVVRIRLVTRLTSGPLLDIKSTNTIEETEKAASNTMQDVVAAGNRAFDRALTRVIGDTSAKLAPSAKPLKAKGKVKG